MQSEPQSHASDVHVFFAQHGHSELLFRTRANAFRSADVENVGWIAGATMLSPELAQRADSCAMARGTRVVAAERPMNE